LSTQFVNSGRKRVDFRLGNGKKLHTGFYIHLSNSKKHILVSVVRFTISG